MVQKKKVPIDRARRRSSFAKRPNFFVSDFARRYCWLYQGPGHLARLQAQHRLLLTIFERGLRGLGLYQWVSTAAFKKIEKAAAFFEKAAPVSH